MQTCDVIILGGGPAGTAAALALTKLNDYSIVVIEKSDYGSLKIGETIQPECRPLLQHLGVWDSFVNDKHLVSNGTCAAWGQVEIGYNDSMFNLNGHGWHLDRARFERTLSREAVKAGVKVLTGTTFRSCEKLYDDKWLINCRTGNGSIVELKGSFVIDASGRRTVFAQMQDAKKNMHDNLCGVFALFKLPDSQINLDSFTFVEATPEGWWYSARLPEDKIILGFMTDGNIIKEKQLNRESKFFEHLKTAVHTAERLHNAEAISKPVTVPANSYILDRTAGDSRLTVGDAACAFDPLSSQGIYKGLHNGITAAKMIDDYFSGSITSLADYENHINSTFTQYLEMKLMYYQMEKRWSEMPFWESRTKKIDIIHEVT